MPSLLRIPWISWGWTPAASPLLLPHQEPLAGSCQPPELGKVIIKDCIIPLHFGVLTASYCWGLSHYAKPGAPATPACPAPVLLCLHVLQNYVTTNMCHDPQRGGATCICGHVPWHVVQAVAWEEGVSFWSSSWVTLWGGGWARGLEGLEREPSTGLKASAEQRQQRKWPWIWGQQGPWRDQETHQIPSFTGEDP